VKGREKIFREKRKGDRDADVFVKSFLFIKET
jgi:hypothetical protein